LGDVIASDKVLILENPCREESRRKQAQSFCPPPLSLCTALSFHLQDADELNSLSGHVTGKGQEMSLQAALDGRAGEEVTSSFCTEGGVPLRPTLSTPPTPSSSLPSSRAAIASLLPPFRSPRTLLTSLATSFSSCSASSVVASAQASTIAMVDSKSPEASSHAAAPSTSAAEPSSSLATSSFPSCPSNDNLDLQNRTTHAQQQLSNMFGEAAWGNPIYDLTLTPSVSYCGSASDRLTAQPLNKVEEPPPPVAFLENPDGTLAVMVQRDPAAEAEARAAKARAAAELAAAQAVEKAAAELAASGYADYDIIEMEGCRDAAREAIPDRLMEEIANADARLMRDTSLMDAELRRHFT
jgi:hypothetical protein